MMTLFDDWPADCEEQFWRAYPRKIAKGAMRKSLLKIRASGAVKFPDILAGVERYKAWLAQRTATCWRPDPAHPSTWLNQERWNDEFGGDHRETTGSIGAAAERLAEPGFSFGPKPGGVLPPSGAGDVRLLAKE